MPKQNYNVPVPTVEEPGFEKISANIPIKWMREIRKIADKRFTSQTQIIKDAIQAYCLKNDKAKTTHETISTN